MVWGLILKVIFPLLLSCWGFFFVLGHGVSFLVGSAILLLTVAQQQVAILEFSQEKMGPKIPSFIIWSINQSLKRIHLSQC